LLNELALALDEGDEGLGVGTAIARRLIFLRHFLLPLDSGVQMRANRDHRLGQFAAQAIAGRNRPPGAYRKARASGFGIDMYKLFFWFGVATLIAWSAYSAVAAIGTF
jgi:hypothetical protein